jgi:hypothetical protein
VQFTKLLQDVRSAFRDIFERNYFITSYMTKQPGVAKSTRHGAAQVGVVSFT